ncbi:hypothetical protein BDZ97DRAFT_1709000 [Flammula alnicola]|nr:hypothetical protein BDZ97DRAFT_1709000 [Flammula alnicola]
MAPKSFKAFLSVIDNTKSTLGDQVVEGTQTRHATHITIAGSSISTDTSILPLDTQPLLLQESTPLVDDSELPDLVPVLSAKKQASALLEEFRAVLPELIDLVLDHNANPYFDDACSCNRPGAKHTTKCNDCFMYQISCSECFIDAHRGNPMHWAEVWDAQRGFFIRHDISRLRTEGYATHLGHHGSHCPNPASETDLLFHFIDTNGIHNTKVRFCGCPGAPKRYQQLMKIGFFPATLDRPSTAFSFRLLKQFHLLHLESKTAAYDFIGTLRRLTDNAFAQSTSDPYPQFRLVMRVWRILQAKKRLGQAHGIDTVLKNRPEGNLLVYCPACPEPGVNMEMGWEKTPLHLRHLNQMQHTADGNHHANKYIKNTDPDDISLFEGKAYFPDDTAFRHYIKHLPAGDVEEEKSTCSYLNAVNKQNRKKFKNMDITGIVNIQCSHVFIQSSVDLQLGERFANTDYALAHAIRQRKIPITYDTSSSYNTCCDRVASYDISCAYCVKIVGRFTKNFHDLLDSIKKIRWLIPLVHVQNHKDNCTYFFSSAYMENVGHFHGETAEHAWPELNQLGAQTRQMNNGHRQDTLIDHHGDWNFKKLANMSATLYVDIKQAKQLFLQKREAFKSLSALYADRIPTWNKENRQARSIDPIDKEVHCVYRQTQKKVPSQSRIYQMLLLELDAKPSAKSLGDVDTKLASFLNEGLLILGRQRNIRAKVGLKTDAERNSQKDRLRNRIDKWRQEQKSIMPQVGEYVFKQAVSGKMTDNPEDEVLYLPSNFTESQRLALELVHLGEYERRLHEGSAYDALRNVRTAVKTIVALQAEKKAQAYGQTRHTRSSEQIRDMEARRDLAMEDYSATRLSMISLGLPENSPQFPPLTITDTFRKPTNIKRAVGDSRRTDGPMWTNTGVTGGSRLPASATGPSTVAGYAIGTQTSRAKLKEGWLWSLKPAGQLSEKELEEWVNEGDRVQWFRAEAEMERWQEEWEKTQADFLRCIRFFGKMHDVWMQLAGSSSNGGSKAYALKKSAMFKTMERNARDHLNRAGYSHLVLKDSQILADLIQEERSKPENSIPYRDFEVSSFQCRTVT